MPTRRQHRGPCPIDWRELSATIRFRRATGRCEHCGRHADVCEQNVEATRSIEQFDCFVSVRDLDHLETLALQGFCGHQSDDGFILYE